MKDSAGNSLAENSIQRIRQLACTLVEDVAQKTGLSYPCEHPLWSWAGRHAAWCLNRYQVGRSLTAHEVTQGKRYDGKVARFGEPVYGYCMGKTENQDAWIIGDGVDVMLSRSIRRVDRPWTNFLAYYSGLQTHSFVYQTNFGGRIVPTKRKIIPQKQDGRLLPKLSGVERRFADEEAKLYRSLVGFGIYLSQERIEIGFIIKQLASGMSNPARGHLQVMRKLIGYLKNTRGHYNRLKAPSHGQGVHHHYDSKWILETFTDSDWSGDRKTRRSTSSAVHCLNGIVVYHSSRGQRVVSLSSAEAELHGLVGGAADGIALRIYLQFLLEEEEIQHVCLIDNSATKQISNKRGTGKLRHVSGKLLWIQDQVSMKVLEVKQISTLLNIGDIGTKPLGKGRLYALMCWCNVFTKEGVPVGEEEAAKAKGTHYNKTSVMRIAKLIQQVVLIGGLEQASGELVPFRLDLETVEVYKSTRSEVGHASYITVVLIFFVVIAVFYYLHKIIRDLRGQLAHLRAELREQQGLQENEIRMHHMHITAMNVAIIRMGGYVNINDPITEQDWDNWHYVERNNKTVDFRKCRRDLEELRKYVHRRRRQNTPRHGSRSRDDDETEEPPQRPEELGEEEWLENVREERRDTLPEAFEGEPEQAGGETEEIDGEHAEGEESESELERSQSFHSGTNDTIARYREPIHDGGVLRVARYRLDKLS